MFVTTVSILYFSFKIFPSIQCLDENNKKNKKNRGIFKVNEGKKRRVDIDIYA